MRINDSILNELIHEYLHDKPQLDKIKKAVRKIYKEFHSFEKRYMRRRNKYLNAIDNMSDERDKE